MATIVYLDADDEITSAATRIRNADASRVGLVLPFGSRVATSRINFRLLAREAQGNGRRLDIVAPDASARALAASAGLPVFASVAEYEAALAEGLDDGPAGAVAPLVAGALIATATPEATGEAGAGSPAGPPTVGAASAGRALQQGAAPDPLDQAEPDGFAARTTDLPVAKPRRRRPGRGAIAGFLILVVAIVVSAAAGLFVLPAADITVTPHIEPVGPIAITVTADPQITGVDPDALVIPAQTLEIPVEVSGEFPATGKRVEEAKAKGKVRWTNCDPTASYTIPRGTVVKTADGIGFVTAEQVLLSVAALSGTPPNLTVQCTTNDVDVTAVEAGEEGNVPAGAIKVVPARYNRRVISVANRAATEGGSRTEFLRVDQKDVDAALASLEAEAETQFATELQDPELAPSGTTIFPETAMAGEPVPTVDPATLVGQEIETFTLGMTATGTVLAVDEGPIEAIAEAQLAEAVDDGYQLVEGSTRVQIGEGTATEGLVDFPVIGSARQLRPLDAAELELAVLGLPKAEAEAALAPYGDVVVILWPGWVTSVPTLDQRVRVIVAEPVDVTPAATPGPTPEPVESVEPDASGGVTESEPVPSG